MPALISRGDARVYADRSALDSDGFFLWTQRPGNYGFILTRAEATLLADAVAKFLDATAPAPDYSGVSDYVNAEEQEAEPGPSSRVFVAETDYDALYAHENDIDLHGEVCGSFGFCEVNLDPADFWPAEPEPDYGSMVFVKVGDYVDGTLLQIPWMRLGSGHLPEHPPYGDDQYHEALDVDPADFHPIPAPPAPRFEAGEKVVAKPRAADWMGDEFGGVLGVVLRNDAPTVLGEPSSYRVDFSIGGHARRYVALSEDDLAPAPDLVTTSRGLTYAAPTERGIKVGDRVIRVSDVQHFDGDDRYQESEKGWTGTVDSHSGEGRASVPMVHVKWDKKDHGSCLDASDLVAFEPLTSPQAGDRVVIVDTPFYRHGACYHVLDWHKPGAVATITSAPDADGDVRVKRDGLDYPFSLSPDCLGRILS